MSHIMFGVMKSSKNYTDLKNLMKIKYPTINILTYEEIDGDESVIKMLKSNIIDINKYYNFILTSKLQPFNSDDLLFPYSKYTNEYLFDEGNNFLNAVTKNLDYTFDMLNSFLTYACASEFKIFITETYDDNFKVIKCSLDKMKDSILNQVLNGYYISSFMYMIE